MLEQECLLTRLLCSGFHETLFFFLVLKFSFSFSVLIFFSCFSFSFSFLFSILSFVFCLISEALFSEVRPSENFIRFLFLYHKFARPGGLPCSPDFYISKNVDDLFSIRLLLRHHLTLRQNKVFFLHFSHDNFL